MPRTIIIRDDDTSFFTPPHLLQRIYGKLWAQGIPVALAVIPQQRGDTRVRHRVGAPYDPSIPPQLRGMARAYPITENDDLCQFLREKTAAGLVEVCLHGYEHRYMEFRIVNRERLSQMRTEGQTLLNRNATVAPIKTFIAPYDHLSAPALEITSATWNICTATHNLAAFPQFDDLQTYQAVPLAKGRALFTCDEYLFNHRDDPAMILQQMLQRVDDPAVDTLIIANHYWTFFYDWADVETPLLAVWDQFVDRLLARDDLRFSTFSKMAHEISVR